MSNRTFFGVPVVVEEAATHKWYANASQWGCDCGHCRNFLALAEQKALPAPILELLSGLGIPPEKATYVCELYPTEQGHCYEFSYRVAGTMPEDREMDFVRYEWGEGRCCHDPYPYGAPDFPEPHFDVAFVLELPWVLEESEEGGANESEKESI